MNQLLEPYSNTKTSSPLNTFGACRFSFNGKEKDDEGLGGGGATYDYGFRIYNPQIAKFLTTDPLIVSQRKYAWYTPYQFAGNTPIQAIDLDGLEEYLVVRWYNGTQLIETTVLKVPNAIQTANSLGNGSIYIELNNDASGRAAYAQLFGGAQGSTTNVEINTNFSAVLNGSGVELQGFEPPSHTNFRFTILYIYIIINHII